MVFWLLVVGCCLAALTTGLLRHRFAVLEHAVTLRYWLLFALLLVVSPVAAWSGPASARNLFVLGAWQLFFVVLAAILTGCSLTLTLRFHGLQERPVPRKLELSSLASPLPLVLTLYVLSTAPFGERTLAILLGSVAGLTLWLLSWFETRDGERPRESHALKFLGVTLGVYLLVGVLAGPGDPAIPDLPPLFPLLLILINFIWLATATVPWLDRLGVSPLLCTVPVIVLLYLFSDSDHYYRLADRDGRSISVELPPARVFSGWSERHPAADYPTVVLVAASGGGIRAALWTNVVLGELSAALNGLLDSIVLFSTVSGGSVGSMYLVDAYSEVGVPTAGELAAIRDASAASGLGATAWGLAYPDFHRLLTGGLLPFKKWKDRGWALERIWMSRRDLGDRTLGEWRSGVAAGWRPAHIFNATLVETGSRFLMSSMDFAESGEAPRLGEGTGSGAYGSARVMLTDLHPGQDLRVVTASRLSATFPYVTPVARAYAEESAYHVADGGYFDNFGVFSALEFIRALGPADILRSGRSRVLLLQIWASSESRVPAGRAFGLKYTTLGPILAMINVRESTQRARNSMETCLLQQLWLKEGVQVGNAVFDFRGEGPLSWHLSENERQEIEEAWVEGDYGELVEGIRSFMTSPAPDAPPLGFCQGYSASL